MIWYTGGFIEKTLTYFMSKNNICSHEDKSYRTNKKCVFVEIKEMWIWCLQQSK